MRKTYRITSLFLAVVCLFAFSLFQPVYGLTELSRENRRFAAAAEELNSVWDNPNGNALGYSPLTGEIESERGGVANYLRMFNGDEVFPKAVVNTLKFAVVTGPLSYLLAYLLAWFINDFNPAVRTVLTFIFYAPAMIGNATFIWQTMFSSDSYGYANSFLISLGIITEPISWFKNEAYNFTILIIVQLWTSMGISFLADIAGLQNVNPELYEAGALDGIKNRWYELWYITLPSMKSILLFGAVMQIQATFSIGAVITALAGYPSVNNSVDTVVSHLLDVGTVRYEMGYAAPTYRRS